MLSPSTCALSVFVHHVSIGEFGLIAWWKRENDFRENLRFVNVSSVLHHLPSESI